MSQTKNISLSKIKDNPWRDRVRNPINTETVDAIVSSIEKTRKYWVGTYGREVGEYVELAFGHHRVEAAKAQGLTEIPISIEPFTDGEMLVWMASENVKGELPVVLEAVNAAVKALGENKIELEPLDPKTRKEVVRYAPSFIPGKQSSTTVVLHPYTVDSLAAYLGYIKRDSKKAKNSVVAAMGILEQAEKAQTEAGGEAGVKKAFSVEKTLVALGVNGAVQAVSDIRRREKARETSMREVQAAEKEILNQQLKLERETKERKAKEREEYDQSLRKEAEARIEEDKREVARQQQRRKDLEEQAKEKEVIDKVKMAAIDAKVAASKEKAERLKKENDYAPILRDVECFLGELETTQAKLLTDNVRSLAKRNLSLKDKQRVWEALTGFSDWAGGWAAAQFVGSGAPNGKLQKKGRK